MAFSPKSARTLGILLAGAVMLVVQTARALCWVITSIYHAITYLIKRP
jgi:hypothetical protein